MTRFKISLIACFLASGLWLAQLATSFPLIRWGCVVILAGYFIAIAVDALFDKAKAEAQSYYGELLTIITPHISLAIALLFLILVGIYIGW